MSTKAITSEDGFHHLVYSISGTTHTLFLDNSAISINTNAGNVFSAFPNISNLFFGTAGDLSYGYTGLIDDVKIYNRALVASDVSSIYTASAVASKKYNLPSIYSSDTTFLLWIDATDSTNFTYSSSNIINSVKNLGYNTTPMPIGGNANNITYLSSNSFTTTPCIQLGSYSSSATYITTNITDINNKKELTFFYVIAYDTTFANTSNGYVQLYGPGGSISNFENTFSMVSTGSTTNIKLSAGQQGASNNGNASNMEFTQSSVPNKFHIVSFTTSILGGGQRIGLDGIYTTNGTGYPGGGASNVTNIISSSLHFLTQQNVVYIKEVLGFTTSFNLTQIQQMEGYLAWKWGLQTNLPSTHPYYASAPSSEITPPIVLMAFTNSSGSVPNTGSLGNSITSTVSTTSANVVGPNGTTPVYQISRDANTLTNFGTLYNFTVTWWHKSPGTNSTDIYLGNTTYNTRLLGTNNVGNQNIICHDGNLNQSGARTSGFTTPYTFEDIQGTWVHYAIVCNLPVGGGAGTVTYYQNGGAVSSTFAYSNYINGFQSFFYFPSTTAYYLYKISVYNSALTLAQIQTIYAQK